MEATANDDPTHLPNTVSWREARESFAHWREQRIAGGRDPDAEAREYDRIQARIEAERRKGRK